MILILNETQSPAPPSPYGLMTLHTDKSATSPLDGVQDF